MIPAEIEVGVIVRHSRVGQKAVISSAEIINQKCTNGEFKDGVYAILTNGDQVWWALDRIDVEDKPSETDPWEVRR